MSCTCCDEPLDGDGDDLATGLCVFCIPPRAEQDDEFGAAAA